MALGSSSAVTNLFTLALLGTKYKVLVLCVSGKSLRREPGIACAFNPSPEPESLGSRERIYHHLLERSSPSRPNFSVVSPVCSICFSAHFSIFLANNFSRLSLCEFSICIDVCSRFVFYFDFKSSHLTLPFTPLSTPLLFSYHHQDICHPPPWPPPLRRMTKS